MAFHVRPEVRRNRQSGPWSAMALDLRNIAKLNVVEGEAAAKRVIT